MRLVVTKCHQCDKITDAKHADTIEELENISDFVREKKLKRRIISVIDYGPSDEPLIWCNCIDNMGKTDG